MAQLDNTLEILRPEFDLDLSEYCTFEDRGKMKIAINLLDLPTVGVRVPAQGNNEAILWQAQRKNEHGEVGLLVLGVNKSWFCGVINSSLIDEIRQQNPDPITMANCLVDFAEYSAQDLGTVLVFLSSLYTDQPSQSN
jgi:hypothetical protein